MPKFVTTTRSYLYEKFPVLSHSVTAKTPMAIIAGVAVAGSLCAFAVVDTEARSNNDAVRVSVESAGSSLQAWAEAQKDSMVAVPTNANSVAVHNGKSMREVTHVVSSDKDVYWFITGTSESFCVKGFSENGGEYTPAHPYTWASQEDPETGSDSCTYIAPSELRKPNVVEPETVTVSGSAGMVLELENEMEPVSDVTDADVLPHDNTDIHGYTVNLAYPFPVA